MSDAEDPNKPNQNTSTDDKQDKQSDEITSTEATSGWMSTTDGKQVNKSDVATNTEATPHSNTSTDDKQDKQSDEITSTEATSGWQIIKHKCSFLKNSLGRLIAKPDKVMIINKLPMAKKEKILSAFTGLDYQPFSEGQQVPLIIFCLSSTRLKVDVDFALMDIELPSQSVMIIVHIGEERNLPMISSAMKLSEYDEYSELNITFIDMLFDHDLRLRTCSRNSDAKEQLYSFIEKFDSKPK